MSFYSLTLQHGVPFQPVSIRVSRDPISLISKLLEQNPRSYTKLDDLVDIGRNLVEAGLVHDDDEEEEEERDWKVGDGVRGEEGVARGQKKGEVERRVIFMAVEAALREEDFETAYSYVVNRLTPSGGAATATAGEEVKEKSTQKRLSSYGTMAEAEDDISWRAAFLAGRYRSSSTSSPPSLRRLEQRTELLSLALLLAPTSALTEILASWRRCEEETTSLHLAQVEAEREFDDRADKRLSGGGGGTSGLPGNFTVGGEQPELVLGQKRREVGRGGGEIGEAPLSMFDLGRGVARAFSKNVNASVGEQRREGEGERGMDMSGSFTGSSTEGGERTRKRDLVANAVSGGLASGLGWVLGATPVGQQQERPGSP